MKFFQIHSFYDRYLNAFYGARPMLEQDTEIAQLSALLDDGFSGSHLFAPPLAQLGVEAKLVIGNCPQLQLRWCKEAGFTPTGRTHWLYEIARKQVESFRPDVLYISDPITYDSRFVRSLSYTPSLVAGWRAAEIPRWVDLTSFDIILSHETSSRKQAEEHGAKSTQFFLPGFPEWIAQRVANEPKVLDMVFCGQITRHHTRRRDLLNQLTAHAEQTRAFAPHFFVCTGEEPPCAPRFAEPSLWGLQMHRAIKRGKVNLNVGIDLFETGAGNMRQFEVTGTGSFLLAEQSAGLDRHFTPGTEVETYSSFDELVEKTVYYLQHDEAREAIARRGQARCMAEHSMGRRSREMLELLESALRCPPKRQSRCSSLNVEVTRSLPPASPDPATLLAQALQELQQNRIDESYKLVLEAQSQGGTYPWLHYLRACCLLRLEKVAEALEDLAQEIALFPDNHSARDLQQQLFAALNQGAKS